MLSSSWSLLIRRLRPCPPHAETPLNLTPCAKSGTTSLAALRPPELEDGVLGCTPKTSGVFQTSASQQANVNRLRVCILRAPMVQDFHIFVGKGSGLIGAPIV